MARAAAARAAPARTAPARPHPARRRPVAPARRPVAPARKPARRASGHGKVKAAVRPGGARILDALLHGRSWIALVGVLLAGIVFFNVDLLQMNREITQVAERAAQVKRENARLRLDVARLASSERIQETAAGLGLVLPAPGQVRYLESHPRLDATQRRQAHDGAQPHLRGARPGHHPARPGSAHDRPLPDGRPGRHDDRPDRRRSHHDAADYRHAADHRHHDPAGHSDGDGSGGMRPPGAGAARQG